MDVIGAPIYDDIIGYGCDVTMKSLLREICEFYRLKYREFVAKTNKGAIQHFIA